MKWDAERMCYAVVLAIYQKRISMTFTDGRFIVQEESKA